MDNITGKTGSVIRTEINGVSVKSMDATGSKSLNYSVWQTQPAEEKDPEQSSQGNKNFRQLTREEVGYYADAFTASPLADAEVQCIEISKEKAEELRRQYPDIRTVDLTSGVSSGIRKRKYYAVNRPENLLTSDNPPSEESKKLKPLTREEVKYYAKACTRSSLTTRERTMELRRQYPDTRTVDLTSGTGKRKYYAVNRSENSLTSDNKTVQTKSTRSHPEDNKDTPVLDAAAPSYYQIHQEFDDDISNANMGLSQSGGNR